MVYFILIGFNLTSKSKKKYCSYMVVLMTGVHLTLGLIISKIYIIKLVGWIKQLIQNLISENYLMSKDNWLSIRGTEMILIMKSFSLSIDISNGFLFTGSLIDYLSYFLSISTFLFGPWISYDDHFKLISNRNRIVSTLLIRMKFKMIYKYIIYKDKNWYWKFFKISFIFIFVSKRFELFHWFNAEFISNSSEVSH